MRDTQLYAQILGITSPRKVTDVELDLPHDQVRVHVEHAGKSLTCPECGTACSGYDKRQRRWRHPDTCQYRTILIADVPLVQCAEHGVKQVAVPWAEPTSRFTAMFEALTIDWLRETSIAAVSRRLNLSWDEVDTIMQRAVDRGLERRELQPPKHVAVDELSQRRGHNYLTVISDRAWLRAARRAGTQAWEPGCVLRATRRTGLCGDRVGDDGHVGAVCRGDRGARAGGG